MGRDGPRCIPHERRCVIQTEQTRWTEAGGWEPGPLGRLDDPQLVLLFGGTSVLREQRYQDDIKWAYPSAHVMGCSTSGEICGTQVFDDSLVATAIQFAGTRISGARIKLEDVSSSFQAGVELARQLDQEELVHVFVLSDGLSVNGSELVAGLTSALPSNVTVTGGLSGDGARFQETLVFWDSAP